MSDLEDFLREHTDDIKVEESSYLSEVPSESSEKTPGSTPSTRQYNKCARSFIHSQASKVSSKSSTYRGYNGPCDNKRARSFIHSQASKVSSESSTYQGYNGPCDQNSVVSDVSDPSNYSELPACILSYQVSERSAESLGSEDSTRSVKTAIVKT